MSKSFDFDDLFKRSVRLIKDPSMLDSSVYPELDQIVLRPYIVQLFKEVAAFFKYRTQNHILVIGQSGSGKTLSAQRVKDIVESRQNGNCKCYYINCRDKSSFDVMQTVLKKTVRGFSMNEVFGLFYKQMNSDVIFIFDEIDRAKKDMHTLLYNLSRPTESDIKVKHKIELVLISNNLSWEESLDTALRSSLQLKVLRFDNYKSKDLFDILKRRSGLGFVSSEVISPEVLKYIAEVVENKRSGDSRAALDILLEAAKDAENKRQKTITEENVNNVYQSVIKHIETERIVRLRNHPFLILYAAMSTKIKSPSKIYEFYTGMAVNLKQKPISQAMFYHHIGYLVSQNLIRFEENQNKKEFVAVINISQDLLREEFEKRITNLT